MSTLDKVLNLVEEYIGRSRDGRKEDHRTFDVFWAGLIIGPNLVGIVVDYHTFEGNVRAEFLIFRALKERLFIVVRGIRLVSAV